MKLGKIQVNLSLLAVASILFFSGYAFADATASVTAYIKNFTVTYDSPLRFDILGASSVHAIVHDSSGNGDEKYEDSQIVVHAQIPGADAEAGATVNSWYAWFPTATLSAYGMGVANAPSATSLVQWSKADTDAGFGIINVHPFDWDYWNENDEDEAVVLVSFDYDASLTGVADSSGYFDTGFDMTAGNWRMTHRIAGTQESLSASYSGHVEEYWKVNWNDTDFATVRIFTDAHAGKTPVPEPASLLLLGLGLMGLVGVRKRLEGKK